MVVALGCKGPQRSASTVAAKVDDEAPTATEPQSESPSTTAHVTVPAPSAEPSSSEATPEPVEPEGVSRTADSAPSETLLGVLTELMARLEAEVDAQINAASTDTESPGGAAPSAEASGPSLEPGALDNPATPEPATESEISTSSHAPPRESEPVASPQGEPPSLRGITAAHNAERERHGLPPLVWDSTLAASAQRWAVG